MASLPERKLYKFNYISGGDLADLDSAEYELLCLNKENGGRDALSNYATCNLAMEPSRTWLSAKDFVSDVSIAHTPLSLADLLNDKKELFNIYGEFLKNNNVIFNVSTLNNPTTKYKQF